MPRKPSKSGRALRQWGITVVRRKGESLGIVEAADADEAIKVAIKAFGITDPERQRRLIAHQIGE